MSNLLNLNKARKTRDRKAQKATADANALRFGQSKAQKEREKIQKSRTDQALDGKRLTP